MLAYQAILANGPHAPGTVTFVPPAELQEYLLTTPPQGELDGLIQEALAKFGTILTGTLFEPLTGTQRTLDDLNHALNEIAQRALIRNSAD
jgi:hypothetical protein